MKVFILGLMLVGSLTAHAKDMVCYSVTSTPRCFFAGNDHRNNIFGNHLICQVRVYGEDSYDQVKEEVFQNEKYFQVGNALMTKVRLKLNERKLVSDLLEEADDFKSNLRPCSKA